MNTWVKRYRGAYHGFFAFPGLLASADEALRDASDFLTAALTPHLHVERSVAVPSLSLES